MYGNENVEASILTCFSGALIVNKYFKLKINQFFFLFSISLIVAGNQYENIKSLIRHTHTQTQRKLHFVLDIRSQGQPTPKFTNCNLSIQVLTSVLLHNIKYFLFSFKIFLN